MFTAVWCLIKAEDNQFCPCPPHPWRSYLLSGDRSWEAHDAAKSAEYEPPPPKFSFQEERRRFDALVDEYHEARQKWLDTSGRELPSLEELRKLEWKRGRE